MAYQHSSGGTAANGQVRVFINYRRGDTKHAAGRMADLIVAQFGKGSVFVDVESIEPGLNYVTAIDKAVSSCDVMLVLIGETWLGAIDDQGHRRIDDPADRLRLEVEAGLRHRTRVIPVLVDSATMPKTKDLPPSLVELSRHQATRVRHDTFRTDAQPLLGVIERTAGAPHTGSPPTGTPPIGPRKRFVSTARWVTVCALVASLLVQLAVRSAVHDDVLASRGDLPQGGPWATLLWLLPSPLVVLAAWLVAQARRPGIALGCITGAALWVITTLVFVEWRVDRPETSSHFMVLTLLLVSIAGLIVAAPETRERVLSNRWDRAFLATVLLLTAIVLRTESVQIAQVITTPGDGPVSWVDPFTVPTIWLAVLIPVLICLPAALVVGNKVQVQALVVLAYLQILYPVVVRTMLFRGSVDRDGVPLIVVADLVFVAGCVCMLMAVQAGQPKARTATH